MKLEYLELEAVIRALHGTGGAPTSLLGRMRYLQGLGWPPGAQRGQGSRAEYGLEETLAVAIAFECLELGLTPARTVRLLRDSWDVAIRALAIGWASAFRHARPVLIALVPRALDDPDVDGDPRELAPDALVPIGMTALSEWAAGFADGAPALYLMDPRRIAASTRGELLGMSITLETTVDKAFLELGTRLFGVDEPSIWEFRA